MNVAAAIEINAHNGVTCVEIAECLGYNLGNAFTCLWIAGRPSGSTRTHLEGALDFLRRYDNQQAPLPGVKPHVFREIMATRRQVFNRPSPWPCPILFGLAAICNLAASPSLAERAALTRRAMQCVEQAITDLDDMGEGLKP